MQSSQSALVCVCVSVWHALTPVRALLFPWRRLLSEVKSIVSYHLINPVCPCCVVLLPRV